MLRTGHLKLWVVLCSGLAFSPAFAAEPPPTASTPAAQPAITDATITADIKARMEQARMLKAAQITIETSDGVVTLVGTVPSHFAREYAVEIARATPGVVRIDNFLRLGISAPDAPAPTPQ
jgi:hyperosmotically inducible protein